MRTACTGKSHLIAAVAGMIILALVSQPLFAQKPFLARAKKVYSLDQTLGTCVLCHSFNKEKGESPEEDNINLYAKELSKVETMKKLLHVGDDHKFTPDELDKLESSLRSIENLDSDGDGATNIEEISLGTFPGDPKSTPAKEALEKYRKEHPAAK